MYAVQVQLAGGSSRQSGRLEMQIGSQGKWGTVSSADATRMRQLPKIWLCELLPILLTCAFLSGTLQFCHYYFDDLDATVVCRQLGLPTPGRAIRTGMFGPGASTSPIWLWEKKCTGAELRLNDCPDDQWKWNTNVCSHSEDVGVVCGDIPGKRVRQE